jgi:hypothetical protein
VKFIIRHQSNIRKQSGPKLFHDPIFSFSFGSECFILENILPAKKAHVVHCILEKYFAEYIRYIILLIMR